MNTFAEISIGFLILLILITIYKVYYIYTHACEDIEHHHIGRHINGSAYVAHDEIHDIIDNRTSKKTNPDDLFCSLTTGFLRGSITGYMINGPESAIVTGLAFGIINVLMEGVEELI